MAIIFYAVKNIFIHLLIFEGVGLLLLLRLFVHSVPYMLTSAMERIPAVRRPAPVHVARIATRHVPNDPTAEKRNAAVHEVRTEPAREAAEWQRKNMETPVPGQSRRPPISTRRWNTTIPTRTSRMATKMISTEDRDCPRRTKWSCSRSQKRCEKNSSLFSDNVP